MTMKNVFLNAVVIGFAWTSVQPPAVVGAAASAPAQSDVLLRCRFAGVDQLFADPNAAKLKQIWSLPASTDLRNQFLDRLALAPFQALSNQLPKGTPDQAALFRPLFDDLARNESLLEWRGPVGQPTEFVLAVQLGEERARVWRTNLWRVMSDWQLGTLAATKSDAGEGWLLKPRAGRGAFGFTRAGPWVVIGWGTEALSLQAAVGQRIRAEGRPGAKAAGYWLEADANLARLKPWLPLLEPYSQLPWAHLTLSNHAENVRTVMRLQYPQPHGWRGERWTIPTNFIRGQLASFTVAQGLAPLLKPLKAFQKLGFNPQPSQFTMWSQAGVPFLTEFAVPMKDASRQLARITPLLPSVILSNSSIPRPGKLVWDTNRQELVWSGVPMVAPGLRKREVDKTEYLMGRLLPLRTGTNVPPREMYQQVLGRTNLAYYDWEITQERLRQWRPMFQLADVLAHSATSSTNAPSQRWLSAVAPLLGNTITEITVTSPTELTLVRKSHSGFTGFELVSFTRWLDSAGFPAPDISARPWKKLPPKAKPNGKP